MIFVRSENMPEWRVLATHAPITDFSFRVYDFMINEIIYTELTEEFINAAEQQRIMEVLTGKYGTVK